MQNGKEMKLDKLELSGILAPGIILNQARQRSKIFLKKISARKKEDGTWHR